MEPVDSLSDYNGCKEDMCKNRTDESVKQSGSLSGIETLQEQENITKLEKCFLSEYPSSKQSVRRYGQSRSVINKRATTNGQTMLTCEQSTSTSTRTSKLSGLNMPSTKYCSVRLEKMEGSDSADNTNTTDEGLMKPGRGRKRQKGAQMTAQRKSLRRITDFYPSSQADCSCLQLNGVGRQEFAEDRLQKLSKAIHKTFHGQMLFRTRCSECENYTERREAFQEIGVPVQLGAKLRQQLEEDGLQLSVYLTFS